MKKLHKISGLACVLLFLSGTVEAAGLGKLSIQSALGQSLRAEIELLSVNKDEIPGINVKLASSDTFRQAHIDRSDALTSLRFSVEQRANGQPVVRITSVVPVNDPFLDVLIELNWSSGRIIREYTLLLDPPKDAAQAAEPVSAPVESARAISTPVEPTQVAEPVSARQPGKPARASADRYGPVKSGETLRSIASQLKASGLSSEQMMVALYQANKGAFFADNMNNLKRGAVLNVPAPEAAAAVDRNAAQRVLRDQSSTWHAYRSKVAENATEAPAAKVPEQAAAGKIATKGAEKPAPAPAASKDVLKLSKGEPGASTKPDVKALEKQRQLEEELAARGRSLQEAQSRVAQLEKTVSDLQKLMDMKTKQAAQAPAPAAPAAVAKPQPAPAPAIQPTPTPAPKPAAEPQKPVPAQAKPPVPPIPVVEPAKPASRSWISTFVTDPLYIGGLIAAVLLSALLWMMMVGSRRRQGLNKFEDSIMTGGDFKNASVFNAQTTVTPGSTTTGGSMLLTDFSRLGLGSIDTHEVDPIAEAEVYMAYGRDAQAEEILKEALVKDPARYEIALKLLEIFAARKDTVAFETAASELYASVGGQNTPVWQRAAEMGRSIDPNNPLYRLTVSDLGVQAVAPVSKPAASEPVTPDTAVPAAIVTAAVVAPVAAVALEEVAKVVSPFGESIDFEPASTPSVDAPTEPEPAEFSAEAEFMPAYTPEPITLDVTELDEHDFEPAPTLAEHVPVIEPEPVLDMQFPAATGLDLSEPEMDFEPVEFDALPEMDLTGIDLEMEEPAPVSEPEPIPEVAPEVEASTPAALPASDFEFEAPEFQPEVEAELVEELEPVAAAVEQGGVELVEAAAEPEDFSDEPGNLWEEVNTKLDLARAYLEMGDKEGAREILQEVVSEGDSNQKAEADKLIAEAS